MTCEAQKRGYKKVRVIKDDYGWPVGSIVWLDEHSPGKDECWNDDCTELWFHSMKCESIECITEEPAEEPTAIELLRMAAEAFIKEGNNKAAISVLHMIIDHE